MAGKRREPVHRAIIYGAIIGELSLDEVNRMLAVAGGRDLPEKGYRDIRESWGRDCARLLQNRPRGWVLDGSSEARPILLEVRHVDVTESGDPTEDE